MTDEPTELDLMNEPMPEKKKPSGCDCFDGTCDDWDCDCDCCSCRVCNPEDYDEEGDDYKLCDDEEEDEDDVKPEPRFLVLKPEVTQPEAQRRFNKVAAEARVSVAKAEGKLPGFDIIPTHLSLAAHSMYMARCMLMHVNTLNNYQADLDTLEKTIGDRVASGGDSIDWKNPFEGRDKRAIKADIREHTHLYLAMKKEFLEWHVENDQDVPEGLPSVNPPRDWKAERKADNRSLLDKASTYRPTQVFVIGGLAVLLLLATFT